MRTETGRIWACLLSLLLFASALAGCGAQGDRESEDGTGEKPTSTSESGAETETESETEKVYTLEVPDKKYDTDFTILTCPGENETTKMYWIHASFDEPNGDLLNDQIVDRNNYIKETLGVEMVVDTSGHLVDTTAFQNAVNSGDEHVQMGIWIDRFALSLAMKDMVTPINELEDYYVNLENPWWYHDMNKDLSIGGDLYFAAGYFNIDLFGGMHVMAFNKDMVEAYGLDNPYELVGRGQWTMDKMVDMMQVVSYGTDPSDENKIWGATYTGTFWFNNFVTVSGENYIKKDKDDMPYLAALGNELLYDIFDMIMDEVTDPRIADSSLAQSKYNVGHVYENVINMFANETALFTGTAPIYLGRLRNTTMDYGICPFPTYYPKNPGDPYSSYITGVVAHFVPSSVQDPEMVSVVMETMAYLSWKNIIPSYVETVLEYKNVRDEESGNMLRMMDKNRVLELGQTYWYDVVMPQTVSKIIGGNGDFVSTFTEQEDTIKGAIRDTVEAFARIRERKNG